MPAKKRTGETATRLPAQPTRLLGRESDLEAIQSVLWREEVRLLTLTGPAGVGKTRLAIEVGTRMSRDFAQGVVFVDLSQIRDPSQVPATLARGVGLQDGESPRLPERLFAYLRERQSLIILDNFEQILPAARWVAELLATCRRITLLVTSREPLHIRWEHTYRVPSLALADPDHLPSIEELAQVPAVANALPQPEVGAGMGIFQGLFFLGGGAGPALVGAFLVARRGAEAEALNPLYALGAALFSDAFLAIALAVVISLTASFGLRGGAGKSGETE